MAGLTGEPISHHKREVARKAESFVFLMTDVAGSLPLTH